MFAQLEAAMQSGAETVTIDMTEIPGVCQNNDLLLADVSVRLENGDLLATTRAADAADHMVEKSEYYKKPEYFRPSAVLAGVSGDVPGLARAVVGMQPGERKTVTIPPEDAFGVVDPHKIEAFPRTRRIAASLCMGTDAFARRYKGSPSVGTSVIYDPYLKAEVVSVNETQICLELSPLYPDGIRIEEAFGSTIVRKENGYYIVELEPAVGAAFELAGRTGRIKGVDGDTFLVDFNHPLAGKSLELDISARDLTKGSVAGARRIDWLEDYEAAAEQSETGNKPLVLVLYADWCQWSRKLLTEALADPRITSLSDRFVWLKIDSGRNPEYKDAFGQETYPMVLVLDTDEAVVNSLSGYHAVQELRHTLLDSLAAVRQNDTRAVETAVLSD